MTTKETTILDHMQANGEYVDCELGQWYNLGDWTLYLPTIGDPKFYLQNDQARYEETIDPASSWADVQKIMEDAEDYANECAYDAWQERLMECGPGPSLAEQQAEAWKLK